MPKPNYAFMKKQREAAKKREQQEKLAKRQAAKAAEGEGSSEQAPAAPQDKQG